MPLVLCSGRLDGHSEEGQPATPGKTWEVIVARHPEQTLIERNQTLVRRLSFRHVSFTLLRAFAYPEWPHQLEDIASLPAPIKVAHAHDASAEIPSQFPSRPEHVDFAASDLGEDAIRAFDLPRRIDAFGQGALVLQWKALPFFYQHQLLLIAQSANTVSPVNSAIQRDFEYRSPTPAGTLDSHGFEGESTEITRELRIPLRRFWDSLPEDSQKEWLSDAPDQASSQDTRRKASSLPDPEVVYEIVEVIEGNIETQFQLYLGLAPNPNGTPSPAYTVRPLGKRLTIKNTVRILAPETPQGDFLLVAVASQSPGRQLAGPEFISARPEDANALAAKIQFEEATDCALVWKGDVSNSEKAALLDLKGDQTFLDAIKSLVADAQNDTLTTKTIPPGPDSIPAKIANTGQLTVILNELERDVFDSLVWTGPLDPDEEQLLRAWARLPELAVAVEALIRKIDGNVVAVPAEGTTAPEVPRDLNTQLQFTRDPDTTRLNCVWRGRITRNQIDKVLAITAPPAIKTAIGEMINRLKSAKFSVLLELPRRPAMSELSDVISKKLLISHTIVRATRLLLADEAREIQELFPSQPDKDAIERLYRTSVRDSLNGSTFSIRARRGSAPCSEPVPLEIAPL